MRGEVPAAIRKSIELWVGCIAGALSDTDYRTKLRITGFTGIDIEVTRVYQAEDARNFLSAAGLDAERAAQEVDGKIVSAFIRAVKPESGCAPACCSRCTTHPSAVQIAAPSIRLLKRATKTGAERQLTRPRR